VNGIGANLRARLAALEASLRVQDRTFANVLSRAVS